MKRLLIGTAGHIDHGKTALIKALTGFDGDETIDEKSRGITIDLSFSHLHSNDTEISFVDVPGHEKLIKNMIAGAFGFDYMLLVVASDDGVMPQTLEHLGVAKVLGIKSIVVAITKSDKNPPDQLVQEIELLIKNYELNLISIVKTSIYDDSSIENLKKTLLNLSAKPHKDDSFFRLYIDRSFAIKGAGSVITGTIIAGKVAHKEKIFVYGADKEAQVRGIEVHKKEAEEASAGSRVALNLSGVDAKGLHRGVVLSKKGFLRGFNKISAHIEALDGKEFRHNSQLQLYIGTASFSAKLIFLSGDGKSAFVDLHLDGDAFAVFGDRFVLRDDSHTIGGGVVLAPIADPMNKEQKDRFLRALYDNDLLNAFGVLVEAHKRGFGLISSSQRFAITQKEAIELAHKLDGVFVDESALVVYDNSSKELLRSAVLSLFAKNPRALLSANSLAIRFKWASVLFIDHTLQTLLDSGELLYDNGLYKSPNCDVKDIKTYIKERIYTILENANLSPDAPYNIYDELDLDRYEGDEALKALTKEMKVVRLAHNLFVTAVSLQNAMNALREIIAQDGFVDVQSAKERLSLSRKYAICYLEYLDKFADIRSVENKRTIV